jgi:hypothetical protein
MAETRKPYRMVVFFRRWFVKRRFPMRTESVSGYGGRGD